MIKIVKISLKSLLFVLFTFVASAEDKILKIGSPDAKITVKVFSSLTCPHCANFHAEIFDNLMAVPSTNEWLSLIHISEPTRLLSMGVCRVVV